MVSLAAVEQYATDAWPEGQHASTSLPDPKKGEQVILLTTEKEASAKKLQAASKGVQSIALPKTVLIVDFIPMLATGKINYPEVNKLAESLIKS